MGHDKGLRTRRFAASLIGARGVLRSRILRSGVLRSRVLRRIVLWGRKSSLWVWPFGQACCGGESIRSLLERAGPSSSGVEIAASWHQADVLVVSGGVTLKSLPALLEIHREMPEPKWVLSLGHGSPGGGPPTTYADAGSVNDCLPVDVRAPACPPTPESLIEGLSEIRKLIEED